jgi:Holliday junction resolvasome RuvABC endonuclease subunit
MINLLGKKRILGIDASTYVGMAQLEVAGDVKKILIHFPDQKGYARLQLIATAVAGVLDEWQPEVVIIEAYGLANKFNLVEMVEIGTIIRRELFKRQIPWYNCPPTVLKLFCTGSGKADKPRMAEAVKDRWNFQSKYDDVIDAFALAKLGEYLALNGPDSKIKGVVPWNSLPTKKRSSKPSRSKTPKKVCAKSHAKPQAPTSPMPSSG